MNWIPLVSTKAAVLTLHTFLEILPDSTHLSGAGTPGLQKNRTGRCWQCGRSWQKCSAKSFPPIFTARRSSKSLQTGSCGGMPKPFTGCDAFPPPTNAFLRQTAPRRNGNPAAEQRNKPGAACPPQVRRAFSSYLSPFPVWLLPLNLLFICRSGRDGPLLSPGGFTM